MGKRVLIVGGVAGGASCAARLRRLDESLDIVMFEKGPYVSFANCGLPYYIGGAIKNRHELLVQTVPGMQDRFNMKIYVNTEVTAINRDAKTVSVTNLENGETREEAYDVLVLSPGASPVKPPIEGLPDAEDRVFTLRNIPDTDAIYNFLQEKAPKVATIIGGGFIGLEMAENLVDAGLKVRVIEMLDQVMAPIDPEMAAEVHTHLKEKGVELVLGDGISAFLNNGTAIRTSSGKEFETDMTILSIGVRSENKLAVDSGLELGFRNCIKVDEYMQTSDPSIYAIGDAIEVKDWVNQESANIALAGPANRQGRMVADNIVFGNKKTYPGTLGSSCAKIFDLTVANTGTNEKMLNFFKKTYQAIHLYPSSHASYYPGAHPISLKVLYNPENGKLYGAQAVGYENVDKTIDVIATAIMAGLTVYQLGDLELCYAPPYNSAKAPVNFAGYIAENIRDGIKVVGWDKIDALIEEGAYILDVSMENEFESGTYPTAVNIPVDFLRDELDDIPKDKTVYVNCRIGLRGYIASRILIQNGFDVVNIDGGYTTWKKMKEQ